MKMHLASMAAAFTMLFAVVLGGCSTRSVGDFCGVAKPFRVSPEAVDAMTPAQRQEALAHNRYGAATCGWTP